MIKNPPPWPDGARCAVVFSFDVDADSVVHATHAERAVDMPHALAHMRYDPLVAVPRLLDLFGGYQVPVTWFVPGWVIEAYPDQVARWPITATSTSGRPRSRMQRSAGRSSEAAGPSSA